MNDSINRHAALDALCDNCDIVESVCAHYPCKQYISIENLPSEEPEPHWIPVTEGLPNHELALVQFSDGDFCLLQFPTAYRRKDIVAWMPKPKPWKGKQDE